MSAKAVLEEEINCVDNHHQLLDLHAHHHAHPIVVVAVLGIVRE
jgi:hypothetical protein